MNLEKGRTVANPDSMFNESDLLFINEFIQEEIEDIPIEKANNYKEYYQEKILGDTRQKQTSTSTLVPTTATSSSVTPQPPNEKGNKLKGNRVANVKKIRRRRKIYIDSQFRDKRLYPDASDMKISWGRTYTNVISMKLNSLEFSNVSKVISSKSNKIYWINQEDDDLDVPYPIYTAELLPGSYTFTALQEESLSRLNVVRRHAGERTVDGIRAQFHYFKMDINEETDLVRFTSIIAKPVPASPIRTLSGDSLVIFQFPLHGFADQETIHIIGVRGILGGIQSSVFNSSFTITVVNENSFTFNITDIFTSSVTGGGSLVKAGREAPYQLLFGEYKDTVADVLGFRLENSSVTIPVVNPITSVVVRITEVILSATPHSLTQIVAPNHGLSPGDTIYLNNFHVTPSVYNNERHRGVFRVFSTPSPDIVTIRIYTGHITDISDAYIGTKLFQMRYPGHGFNRIVDIEQVDVNLVSITTLYPHGLQTGGNIRLNNTNSVPIIDGYYRDIVVTDLDTFTISNPVDVLTPEILPLTVTTSGFSGILASDYKFFLFNVLSFGGFTTDDLNSKQFQVRYIIDQDTFVFSGTYGFSTRTETGGGDDVRINSKIHGWNGNNDNSPNGVLNKPVKLSGDNYAYLCIPNINSDSTSSNGPVKDIFAKLFITSNPGIIIFNQFDPAEIEFINPIPQLDELHFQVRSPLNEITSFGGLDYSFGLEIVEEIEIDDTYNVFGSRVLLDT